MPLAFMALEKNAAINFKIPKPDRAIFMTSGDQAALGEESHAAELRVLRSLHPSDDLELFVVPKQDGVVKASCDDFRSIGDLFDRICHHLVGLKHDDLDNGIGMALHIMRLHTFLYLANATSIHEYNLLVTLVS